MDCLGADRRDKTLLSPVPFGRIMLNQILSLLLQVVFGLLVGVCLLRLYMQYQRVALSARSGNPLGPFIFALTDWIVLPLRRVIPPVGRWDMASLLAAYLLELGLFLLFWVLAGANGFPAFIALAAFFGVVRLALTGLSGLVIVYAVLSWVRSDSPLVDIVGRLVTPLLQPIRRVVPLVGGIDLSPLALLVLLQIAGIVVETLQATAF